MLNIYNKHIPVFLRKFLINYRNFRKWYPMSRTVEKYYKNKTLNEEQLSAISYLKDNHFHLNANKIMYLSDIVSQYEKQYINIPVYRDDTNELPYIIHQNKPLYYPKNYTPNFIRSIYCQFLSEMDYTSPHVYCVNPEELNNRVLFDCGVAEGLFPLTYIDRFSKLILFECDPKWIEPLNATFEPYKEKVSIISKYITNINTLESTTLDSFHNCINDNSIFVKMDIEGFEEKAIQGAKKILNSNNDIICAICTYHTPEAESNITSTMEANGFTPQYNQGYMVFHCEDTFTSPYLRRGVIRFYKNKQYA